MNKTEIDNMLEEVGLSPAEISVYLSLLDGLKSVQEIVRATEEKRPTVYYSLNSLEKRGLVSKTGKEYGNKFQVEPIDKISELINKNIRKQTDLLKKAESLKDIYSKKTANNKVLVSFFDTMEAIKLAIFYSLYNKEKTIRTIVPGKNFFHEMGIAFVEEYVEEKLKRGIKTMALWEDIPDRKIMEKYYSDSDIKQLPVSMHNNFETTVFIYGDKTLYVSPKKDHYAVLVQSKEHSKMMISIFDNLWENSLSIKR